MKKTGSTPLAFAAALLVLAGCDHGPTGTSAPTQFMAAISGSITADFVGTGYFETVPIRAAIGRGFSLRSRSQGGPGDQEFQFHAAARPEAGTYSLGQATGSVEHAIKVEYHVWEGNAGRAFFADAGELRITHSSRDLVEGSFRFTATLAAECERGPGRVGCRTIPASAERPGVEVEGTFQARPGRLRF